jgi:hypothetical protein
MSSPAAAVWMFSAPAAAAAALLEDAHKLDVEEQRLVDHALVAQHKP